jgi:hypothetical protein
LSISSGWKGSARISRYFIATSQKPASPSTLTEPKYIIGIVPSYIISTAADPFHIAASLVVHHGGFAIAGSVRVEHNPFRISEFTVHEVKDDQSIGEFTIRADQLCSLSAAEVNKFLGRPPITERHKWGGGGVMGPGEQSTVASIFFQEVRQVRAIFLSTKRSRCSKGADSADAEIRQCQLSQISGSGGRGGR